MPEPMPLWSFRVHGDIDDASLVHELGPVAARSDDAAMRRGFFAYVSVGLDAAHYSERFFGGNWKDYPTAFFSVVPLDEEKMISESKHFAPEDF